MTQAAAPPAVPDAEIAALRDRIRSTRRVADLWAGDSARGVGGQALDALLAQWADGYDWRRHEDRIRALPWELVDADGTPVRVVHQRSTRPDAPVVVLLHGWPDSVLRFERVLPELTDVHVVVPALPGFPFAPPLTAPVSANAVADLVAAAMTALGHDRFVVSGGDVGGTVAEILAGDHPDRVTALHLTDVSAHHARTADPARLPADARPYLAQAAAWFRTDGGYIGMQSTRPSTLGVALGDSPAGLAAWIVEKLRDWSDDVAASFTVDDLLTWVSASWFTGTIGTSFSTYAEPANVPDRVETPTVFSAFPADIKPAPRAYVESFVAVEAHVAHGAGGHFAAWEQPAAYADDVRRAVSLST